MFRIGDFVFLNSIRGSSFLFRKFIESKSILNTKKFNNQPKTQTINNQGVEGVNKDI